MTSNNDRESQCEPSSQRSLRVENLEDRNLYAADIVDSLEGAESNAIAQQPTTPAEISGAADVDHRLTTGDVAVGTPFSLVTDPPIDMENDVLTMPPPSAMTREYYVPGEHNDPNLPVTDEVLIRGYAISSPTDSSSVGSSVVIIRGSEPALSEQSDPRTAVATDVVLSQNL